MIEHIHKSVFSPSEKEEMRFNEIQYMKQARDGNPGNIIKFWADKRNLIIARTVAVVIPKDRNIWKALERG